MRILITIVLITNNNTGTNNRSFCMISTNSTTISDLPPSVQVGSNLQGTEQHEQCRGPTSYKHHGEVGWRYSILCNSTRNLGLHWKPYWSLQ